MNRKWFVKKEFTVVDMEKPGSENDRFHIADLLPDGESESWPKSYGAAETHVKRLRRAEGCLDEALNLAGVLRVSQADFVDARAMQAETVLKIIEKKISKAQRLIDEQDTRDTKLFMAYSDLRGKSAGS